jgi:ATP synthase protein I
MVNGTSMPNARRVVFSVVLGQAAVTVTAALLALVLSGELAALSALVGGGISTVATLAMAVLCFSRLARGGALQMVGAVFAGEIAKIVMVIVGLALVWRWMTVSPVALLGTFIATLLVYWVALAGLLLSGSRGQSDAPGMRAR